MNTIKSYIENVRRFSPEARLYLMAQMIQGISWGVFRLFFNFYVLSLGYRRDFLGLLISLPSLTALVVALFAGYVSDLIGRKRAFMLGVLLSAVAQLLMLVFTTRTGLVLTGVLRGIGMSLFNVTAAPFLMEHSTESERTHLFSFSSGITTTSSFVGNFLGGFLPAIFAVRLGVDSTSSTAYAWSLGTASLLGFITLIPFSRLDLAIRKLAEDPGAPFKALWKHRGPMTRLLLPSLILSLGAGMLMPFMNIFFRFRYDLSDRAIGSLFGFGSLAMGIAIFVAPVLAERWGKAKTVVITQGLSIPFLILLGFVPSLIIAIVAYFMRLALMNLAGPVYQTMVMEEASEDSRGMAASLYNMIWSLGWTVSPSISGPIQAAYGFDPVFATTIGTYALSIYLVYRWFVRERSPARNLDLAPNVVDTA